MQNRGPLALQSGLGEILRETTCYLCKNHQSYGFPVQFWWFYLQMGILNVQCMAFFSWGDPDENQKHLRFRGLKQSHICLVKVIETRTYLLRIPLRVITSMIQSKTRNQNNPLLQRIFSTAKSFCPATHFCHCKKSQLQIRTMQKILSETVGHRGNPLGISVPSPVIHVSGSCCISAISFSRSKLAGC